VVSLLLAGGASTEAIDEVGLGGIVIGMREAKNKPSFL